MFSLNESNRFVVCREATDMRKGANMLCGEIRESGLDPTNGDVYVFIGASRHILKLLVWENGGYAIYYKRLEAGRISPTVFHHGGGGFRPMCWEELVLFMMGISPKSPRRRRYQTDAETGDKKTQKTTKKSPRTFGYLVDFS